MTLSSMESQRYARHIVLKGIGGQGQQLLKSARVLVIGAGGLGSPIIAYLGAAGIGTIGIVDDDHVSLSNLQRQIIHTVDGIDASKTGSAQKFITALNPEIDVVVHQTRVCEANAGELLNIYDLIIDGTDRFSTHKLIAESAEALGKTTISGGVSMFDGHLTVLAPHETNAEGKPQPRFCDLYPDTASDSGLPTCEEVGVLGATTGVIGTLMAMEAIKIVTRTGTPLIGRLLLYDGREAKFTEVRYKRTSPKI